MGNQCCVPHQQQQYSNKPTDLTEKQPANSDTSAVVKIIYHPIPNSNYKIETDGAMIAEGLVLTSAQSVYNLETKAQNSKELCKVYLGSSANTEDYQKVDDWRFQDAYKSCPKEKKRLLGYALIKLKKNEKKPIKIRQYLQVTLPCECMLSQSTKDRIKTTQKSSSKSNLKYQPIPNKKDKAKELVQSLYDAYQDEVSQNPSSKLKIRHKTQTFPLNSGHPITIDNKIIAIHLKDSPESQERLVTMNMIDQLKKWSEELRSTFCFQEQHLCVHLRERAALLKEETGQAAKALEELASEYFQEDNFPVALDKYMKALGIYGKQKKDSSIDKARVLLCIASIYRQQGNYTKTHEYYASSLQQEKQAKGESVEVITLLDRMAEVYTLQENYYEAIKAYFQSLRVKERLYGKESIQAGEALLTIGNLYRTQQKYPKAQEHLLQALQIIQKVKGKNSLQTAQTLYSLANVSYRRKEYPKCIQIYKQALSIFVRLDQRPPNYAYSQFNLGNTYCKMKEYKLAAQCFEDSIFSFKRQKMEEDVGKSATKLAKCLKILKQVKRMNQVIAEYKIDPQAL